MFLANAAPGLNVAADIAMTADIASMAADFAELKRDTNAALEFIKNGPYKFEDLLVDKEQRSFSSFAALKKNNIEKFYGPAGDGWEYHHIVEQGQQGNISSQEINSTGNVIRIPRLLHEVLNGEYGRLNEEIGTTLRASLKGMSYNDQYRAGIEELRRIGVIL
jgi:hypothetical protein